MNTTAFRFKKPRDVEEYITIWGLMDNLIRATKKGVALNKWKLDSVPHTKCGKVYGIVFSNFGTDDGGSVYRPVKYDDIIVNRYWFKHYFEIDMRHYKRLYTAFCEVMAM